MNDDLNSIRETTEAIKTVQEAFPALYEDLLQPAAKELGSALQTLVGTINLCLAPLEFRIMRYRALKEALEISLAEKLKDVPEDRLVTPNLRIAKSTIEELRYSTDEPQIWELFANLLASAMDKKTLHYAHPAFVEIIKQLTPDEAQIIQLFELETVFPVRSLYCHPEIEHSVPEDIRPKLKTVTALRNFSTIGYDAGCLYPELAPDYIDNLCRLNLTTLASKGVRISSYDPAEVPPLDHPEARRVESEFSQVDIAFSHLEPEERQYITKTTFSCDQKSLHVTDFGKRFVRASVGVHAH